VAGPVPSLLPGNNRSTAAAIKCAAECLILNNLFCSAFSLETLVRAIVVELSVSCAAPGILAYLRRGVKTSDTLTVCSEDLLRFLLLVVERFLFVRGGAGANLNRDVVGKSWH